MIWEYWGKIGSTIDNSWICVYLKFFMIKEKIYPKNFLLVQWLGSVLSFAKSPGSIPGRETKIPQAAQDAPTPNIDKRFSEKILAPEIIINRQIFS